MKNRIADIERRKRAKPATNGHANGHGKPVALPLDPDGDGAPTGKDAKTGRFQAGNRFGRGNPHARRQAEMHQAMLDAVTPRDVQTLAVSLWTQAQGGDVAAAALLLSYLVGKPRTAPDADRLDLDEFALAAASPTLAEVARANGDGVDPATAALLVRYFMLDRIRKSAAKDALSPEELSAILAEMTRIQEAMEEAEDDSRDPFSLQFGELRKTRCKRGK